MERYYVYESGESGVYVTANSPEQAVEKARRLQQFTDEVFAVVADGAETND